MKDTPFTKAAEEVVALKMRAVDEYIKEIIEPLNQVGSPESLIGKKYEDWTPQDLMMLKNVYGESDESPLAKLIFNKEFDKLKKLESEV